MAKKGSTAKVGAATTDQGKKDFQGSGVEGAKAAGQPADKEKKAKAVGQPADKEKKAEAATDSGIVTGEHVLALQRAQGKAA
jgi:hypothetical protein